MDFGEVLGRAWRIIWKHKILWIFGIFAGCSRGGGGGGGGNSGSRITQPGGSNPAFNQYATQFGDWIASHPWVVVLFVLIIFVIVILAAMLASIGRIGLIRGTFKADGGAEHLGFAELWDGSLPYFWRIFWLSLLVGLLAIVVSVVIVGAGIAFTVITLGLGVLCFLPLICILVIALWFLGIVVQQAQVAIVLEDLGIAAGLQRGWDVFRQNLGPMLIMWLILAVINLVVSVVIALPILIVVVPAAIIFAANSSEAARISFVPLIVALACCAVYLPFLLVLNGILMSYLQSAWTLTFMRLTRPKPSAASTPSTESPVIPAPNA
jgi:hypothetical protein